MNLSKSQQSLRNKTPYHWVKNSSSTHLFSALQPPATGTLLEYLTLILGILTALPGRCFTVSTPTSSSSSAPAIALVHRQRRLCHLHYGIRGQHLLDERRARRAVTLLLQLMGHRSHIVPYRQRALPLSISSCSPGSRRRPSDRRQGRRLGRAGDSSVGQWRGLTGVCGALDS